MKLTDREIILTAAKFPIDCDKRYWLITDYVPVRYDYRTLPKLQREALGL